MAEREAQETVFMAAAAALSGGQPVDEKTLEALRAAMMSERVEPDLAALICERCAAGIWPQDVPVNRALSREQVALLAAALIFFALRAAPYGDPIDLAARLCLPYGVTSEFVAAFARELSLTMGARRSADTAESLRLLLEPPERLVSTLRRYQSGTEKVRSPRRSVAHVSPRRIQHEDDREASDALREASGFDDLTAFVMKHSLEKMWRVNNIGSKARVGPDQFSGLYEIFRGCVARSGVKPEPELYLENGAINAYTFGAERPYIVLHTGAITQLSTAELEFIIGHELGHIRFRHVPNLALARMLPRFLSQLPLGGVIAAGVDVALFGWGRKAELSADRMGLLVCQDYDAALRVMVKLSGVPTALYPSINVEAFLAQYDDFEALDREATGAIAKIARSVYESHPWTVVRAHELRRWVEAGDYERLLAGGSQSIPNKNGPRLAVGDLLPFECPICGAIVPVDARECGCGAPCTEGNRFRRCVRCGAPGKPSQQFCESCGARQ